MPHNRLGHFYFLHIPCEKNNYKTVKKPHFYEIFCLKKEFGIN